MNDICRFCNNNAEYVIQWGPGVHQKKYVCAEHVKDQLEKIAANEMYIVKIEKTA